MSVDERQDLSDTEKHKLCISLEGLRFTGMSSDL